MRYLAILMMLMSVAACGSDDKTGNTTTGSTTATTGATTSTAGTTTGATTTTTGGTSTTTTGGAATGTTTSGGGTTAIQVAIQNFAFVPSSVSATVGTPIVFTNKDSTTHTASSTSGAFTFDSGNLPQNSTFTFTPNAAGNGNFRCNIHPSMLGSLTVTAQ